MPQITVNQKDVDDYKNKKGVYRTLSNRQKELIKLEKDITNIFENNLKQEVTKIVERAFRAYCKAHKANADVENKEWSRFNRFLQKVL